MSIKVAASTTPNRVSCGVLVDIRQFSCYSIVLITCSQQFYTIIHWKARTRADDDDNKNFNLIFCCHHRYRAERKIDK